MTNKQLQRYEMLVRVSEFGAKRQELFPEGSVAGRAFAVVADAVKQLSDRAVAQMALRREGSRARAAARLAVLKLLRAISRTARIIQTDDPSFPNTFHLPDRESAQVVLTTARLFARDIEAVAQPLIDHKLSPTIVADLKTALEAFEQSILRREVGKGESAAARAAIDQMMASAFAAVRRLDIIVANQLQDDAATIAEWERDRQIPYPRRDAALTTPEDGPPAVVPMTPVIDGDAAIATPTVVAKPRVPQVPAA